MRLMKRGQRNEPLQPGYDAMVDQHRPVIVRTAMNDAMTDSHRVDAKLVAQPFACDTHRGRNVRDRFYRIDAVGQRIAVRTARPQARTTANAVHLALDMPPKLPLPFNRKDLELDARGTCIDDEDRIHGDHAAIVGACWRLACAESAATAQEAIRARAESARDVRTTGTRAPSTMPAPSALAK